MMHVVKKLARQAFTLAALLLSFAAVPTAGFGHTAAQQAAVAPEVLSDYEAQDIMIPMRDGVHLHAQVWRPKGSTEKLPILMTRSPYGFTAERIDRGLSKTGGYAELAEDKFIFVFQDIRGRFGSEGEFVNLRPLKKTANGIDEATDTYDTIDWLVKNLPDNNGKAGVFGVSYGGWTAAVATVNPHPALKAVTSQASPEDMFIGDDFSHNGAFRLDYAWSWVSALETDGRTMNRFDFGGTDDAYEWYLKQTDLANMDQRLLGRSMPSWQNFVSHPSYDSYWKDSRPSHMMSAKVAVPNLIVAGWWDQEDFYGPMTIYGNQEKGDADGLNYLVVGPWNHGGWRGEGSGYGPFELGEPTGKWFRAKVELPWFRHWLKGIGKLDQPEALVFQSGSNQWQRLPRWPAAESQLRNLYFQPDGRLSFDAPRGRKGVSKFVSDPANPVPYRDRAILKPFMRPESNWSTWLSDDQAPFVKRNDVLFWQTEPLTEDLTIAGDIAARIFASTTGSDADWVVKLIDVYPSDEATPEALRGRQRMIANDVFRGRFRNSYEKPQPVTPGKALEYTIDLHSASHVFRKGHRIAVQVQSSWFPLIDRNPQTFVPNILKAKPEDYKAQTHAIFYNQAYPSSISMAVIPNTK